MNKFYCTRCATETPSSWFEQKLYEPEQRGGYMLVKSGCSVCFYERCNVVVVEELRLDNAERREDFRNRIEQGVDNIVRTLRANDDPAF